MLTTEQQLAELDRVVAMCRGTKLEGKEHLCIKLLKPDNTYTDYSVLSNVECIRNYINKVRVDRRFAIAIVDDTPIFLEEPFTLTHTQYDGKFIYNAENNRLETVEPLNQAYFGLSVSVPIKNVVWSDFRLYKEADVVKIPHIDPEAITTTRDKQIGWDHYKKLAIQPIDYAKANYPREQLRIIGRPKGVLIMKVVTKEALEELLQERKAMCNCGCGWGNEDGHEWEILLLEKLLNEYIVEIKEINNDNS